MGAQPRRTALDGAQSPKATARLRAWEIRDGIFVKVGQWQLPRRRHAQVEGQLRPLQGLKDDEASVLGVPFLLYYILLFFLTVFQLTLISLCVLQNRTPISSVYGIY